MVSMPDRYVLIFVRCWFGFLHTLGTIVCARSWTYVLSVLHFMFTFRFCHFRIICIIAQQCFEQSARFIKLIMFLILEMLLLCILFLVCNYAYTHPQMFSIILEKIISNIPPAEIWDLSEYNFAYLGTII
jgi:hypothetical protein